jgi:two-component system, LytTR family, response regulator LytT
MRIVIIEDEAFTADDLADTIRKLVPGVEISAVLRSVKESVAWFRVNEHPDLIFSDIQLGDGLCFEIFKTVMVDSVIIFCTAYDSYALQAFGANGIDYILKPFDESGINEAFKKYNKLKEKFANGATNFDQIIRMLADKKKQVKGSILVYKQDKILPVRVEDIALFYIENEVTCLLTFDEKKFTVNKTIEEIEKSTSEDFFRINRQCHVNRHAIKEASQYFARKLTLTLTIPFKDQLVVSKLKVPAFLSWLATH